MDHLGTHGRPALDTHGVPVTGAPVDQLNGLDGCALLAEAMADFKKSARRHVKTVAGGLVPVALAVLALL